MFPATPQRTAESRLAAPEPITAAETITQNGGVGSPAGREPYATSARAITPMVFWASLVPCASASSPPDTTCPPRNPLVTGVGRNLPTIRYSARIETPPTTNASVGARSAGIITFPTTPSPKKTASGPSATSMAPTTPPIRAWDELDGSPKYQVTRFHAIAPTRPPNTTSREIEPGSTTLLATVAATSSEMNAPAKLRSAA